jgi:hypothetical protein
VVEEVQGGVRGDGADGEGSVESFGVRGEFRRRSEGELEAEGEGKDRFHSGKSFDASRIVRPGPAIRNHRRWRRHRSTQAC